MQTSARGAWSARSFRTSTRLPSQVCLATRAPANFVAKLHGRHSMPNVFLASDFMPSTGARVPSTLASLEACCSRGTARGGISTTFPALFRGRARARAPWISARKVAEARRSRRIARPRASFGLTEWHVGNPTAKNIEIVDRPCTMVADVQHRRRPRGRLTSASIRVSALRAVERTRLSRGLRAPCRRARRSRFALRRSGFRARSSSRGGAATPRRFLRRGGLAPLQRDAARALRAQRRAWRGRAGCASTRRCAIFCPFNPATTRSSKPGRTPMKVWRWRIRT